MTPEHMTPEHIDEVADLFYATFTAAGEKWTRERAKKHIIESYFGECHYVVKKGTAIVGVLLAFPLTKVAGTELYIDTIAVHPQFQKNGIGTMLITAALEYAKKNDLVAVSLSAHAKLKSFTWYQSLGFVPTGWVELIKMEKNR
ncbi:MAG: GNAT family N-acetyltransferase [Candidatus Roizmanbacteria bacterium]|nr:GNAT family N-acetyltransferase [Candidatus Roizmanbacteria bacterium]